MKILTIPDDSGFLGIANFERYNAFVAGNWDFYMMKKRIIEQMNSFNLLFWATGFENTWKVEFTKKESNKQSFRETEGIIEVTNQKLYLTNYESLTMAAQFEHIILPEEYYEDLFLELENGKYKAKIKQLFNPDEFDFDLENVNFEIVLQKIESRHVNYKNDVNEIYWSEY